MVYLSCSEHDCCHNKGGQCCRNDICVHCEGATDAVCSSYCCNDAYANAATDNPPPSAETAIRCGDKECCFNNDCNCCAGRVDIKECSCGPACATRRPE